MNSKVLSTIVFVAGVAVGSVATWQILNHKYEEKTRTEIESVKQAFAKRDSNHECCGKCENEVKVEEKSEVLSEIEAEIQKHVKREYNQAVTDLGYTDYSNYSKEEEDEDCDDQDRDNEEPPEDNASVYCVRVGAKDKPYVIPPEEFGELDDFDTATLIYYADGILADDLDNAIESVDSLVGLDSLDHFGENEDDEDAIYVRNEQFKCDYEILLDLRRWEDIVNPPKVKTRPEVPRKPHQMED